MKCTFSHRCAAALAVAAAAVLGGAARPVQAANPDVKAVYLNEPEPAPTPQVVGHAKLDEKYADGSIRVHREVVKLSDDQIINDGRYTEYYPNGKKFAEGNYIMGVHDGEWSFWHDNGQAAKTVTFKNGRADGEWEVHRPDGTLQAKKSYKDNQRQGTWVVYYEDGKTPQTEQSYVDGVVQGVRKTYFANGKLHQESHLKAGQFDGLVTEWDDTGRKVAEATFAAGKLNGTLTRWGSDGHTSVQTFKDNKFISAKDTDEKGAPIAPPGPAAK
jgi:antitoxin component YwqK of YwqJK toxin-antitoxin module